jgi:hypothetical protein
LASFKAPSSAQFVHPSLDCDGKRMEKTRQPLLPRQKRSASHSNLQIHCRVYRTGGRTLTTALFVEDRNPVSVFDYRKLRIRGSIDYPLAGVAVVLKQSNGHKGGA